MTTVFRPGVFDLLHGGHVNAIRHAATLGQRLIVGVQDGRDVLTQKGVRPRVPLAERMEVVGALRGVAKVISYRRPFLGPVLQFLGADVLAVGEGYGTTDADQRHTVEWCERQGVQVAYHPLTAGVSSTQRRSDIRSFWERHPTVMLGSCGGCAQGQQEETEREVALLRRHLPRGGSVLDLGCGDGRLALPLQRAGYTVTGVDGSARKLSALAHAGIVCHEADAAAWLPEQQYDAVLLSGLLPYLDDAQLGRVVKTVGLALEPGGVILIRTTAASTERIDVINQFSEALSALYTAYYRTLAEVLALFAHRCATVYPLYQNQPDSQVVLIALQS